MAAIWQRVFGDVTPAELREALGPTLPRLTRMQRELATRVSTEDRVGEVRAVAGVDVSNNRFSTQVHAGVVLLSLQMELTEEAGASSEAALPYVPGFLGFRELPVLLAAWDKLSRRPDVVLV